MKEFGDMSCKHCVIEIEEDGSEHTHCPIRCQPIRGKWQRLVYESVCSVWECEGEEKATTQSLTINYLKRSYPQHDVRQQYIQRAFQALLSQGYIIKVDTDAAASTGYAPVALLEDAPLTNTRVPTQALYEALVWKVVHREELFSAPTVEVKGHILYSPRIIANTVKEFIHDVYEEYDLIFEVMEPMVNRLRNKVTKLRKTKVEEVGAPIKRVVGGKNKGDFAFHCEFFKQQWGMMERDGLSNEARIVIETMRNKLDLLNQARAKRAE